MDYKKRINTLRQYMEEEKLDGMLVGSDATWEYLTGANRIGRGPTHERQNSLEFSGLLVTSDEVVLFIPRLTGMGVLPFIDKDSVITQKIVFPDEDLTGSHFIELFKTLKLIDKRIGVNRDVTSTQVVCIQEILGNKVVEMSAIIDKMRAIKDADEIILMKENAKIADMVYADVMPLVRPGAKVRDIEIAVEEAFRAYGCSRPSFHAEAIVVGPKAGPIFGMHHDTVEKGHSFAFDFGGVFKGYCSDFGRTVFIGEPDKEFVRYHELVMKAQKAGIEAFKPGVTTCEEVNRAARAVIEEAGLGEKFIHRLGHGIGKDVHERPFLAKGEKTIIQPGMTFTAEPSIVIVQKCCIRVEDVVLVTEKGCECLNKVTKEIVVVD